MGVPKKPRASVAACWKGFFGCHQSVHHTRSTARFWQNTTSTPSNATRARQNAAPGRRLPARRQGRAAVEERGVSDRILNEWCAPFVSSGSIERMVCDEYRGCGRADFGLSFSPATRCGLRRRGPHSNRYRTGKGHRKAAAAKWGIFSRRRRRRATHPAHLRESARARVIV